MIDNRKKIKINLLEKYDPDLCKEFVYAFYMFSDLKNLQKALDDIQRHREFLLDKIKWLKKRGHTTNEFDYLIEILEKQETFVLEVVEEIRNNKLAKTISLNLKRILEQNHININDLANESYFSVEELKDIQSGNYGDFDTVDLCHLMEICRVTDLKELTRREKYETKDN